MTGRRGPDVGGRAARSRSRRPRRAGPLPRRVRVHGGGGAHPLVHHPAPAPPGGSRLGSAESANAIGLLSSHRSGQSIRGAHWARSVPAARRALSGSRPSRPSRRARRARRRTARRADGGRAGPGRSRAARPSRARGSGAPPRSRAGPPRRDTPRRRTGCPGARRRAGRGRPRWAGRPDPDRRSRQSCARPRRRSAARPWAARSGADAD